VDASQAHIRNYRPEIDGLRCLAVLPVIFYHANIAPFSGGYVGVDIFFVISGYLITSILLGDLDKGRFSIASFYERRVRRIFPALFVVTAATFAGAWFVLSPGEMQDFGQSVVATMAFASNLLFFLKSGYFTPDVETFPLIHMWSLAVEEQFYIVFPPLLYLVYRHARRWLSAVLFAVVLASLLLSIDRQNDYPAFNFFLPFTRAWELMAGALIAANDGRWRGWLRTRSAVSAGLEAAGVAMILAAIFLYDRATPFPGWAAIPPVLGTASIIAASSSHTPVGRLLSTRLFVGVGLLSYSAYLWHQPLFALARSSHGLPLGAHVYIELIAATFLLSYLSWRFVERPFRARSFLTRRSIFLTAAALTVLLAALGLLAHRSGGFPSRYPAQTIALARTMELSPKRKECHTDGLSFRRPAQACRFFGGRASWAALGDSHAIEFAYALAERLRPRGESVVQLSFSSCQPAIGFASSTPGCSAWIEEAVRYLEGEPQVENVLIAFRHALYLYGDQRDTYPQPPLHAPLFLRGSSAEEAREAYWHGFDALVARLRAAGKRVYLVEPVPELPTSADYIVFKTDGPAGDRPGAPIEYYARRQGPILDRIRAIAARRGASVIRPAAALCAAGSCAAIVGGEALYFDDNHLSMPGARRVLAFEAARGRLP
jgi:peptidoglycan/LPS O-acetylase OafA/YrhL